MKAPLCSRNDGYEEIATGGGERNQHQDAGEKTKQEQRQLLTITVAGDGLAAIRVGAPLPFTESHDISRIWILQKTTECSRQPAPRK